MTNFSNINEIKQALLNSTGSFIDDHSNSSFSSAKAFALLQKGNNEGTRMQQYLCPLPDEPSYGSWVISLNPLYIEDGKLRLSTMSISVLNHDGNTIEEAVAEFNEDAKDGMFGTMEIVKIFKG